MSSSLPEDPLHPPSESLLTTILLELSKLLSVPASALDAHTSLREQGLDSAGATALVAELSRELGRELSPVLAWQHPTAAKLAAHLSGEASSASSATLTATRHDEPIAIVGMACRLPGGVTDPESFWRLLTEGVDAITEVPSDRWDVDAYYDPEGGPGKMNTRWGGFLDRVDGFEPGFFGISPREAEQMDPQQRLMLELSWEALEDTGTPPGSLRERAVGVFTGVAVSDYETMSRRRGLDAANPYSSTGTVTNGVSNRVSYSLGLMGPSLTVNTACSSSLVSVHLAAQALRSGECDVALAGGVHLNLTPETFVEVSKFGALSPDGRCFTFDARANGYVRGEGGGVLVLKPLSAAEQDGDRIYAVLRGSALNNDGPSNGLTAPNPEAQVAVLREACARGDVRPETVGYVELHGTGTRLGDPIEAGALGAVYGQAPGRAVPLRVGSVKTNIGHLEGAAGVAGLMKAALSLHHRALVPSLHFEQVNPHIDLGAAGLEVVTEPVAWSSSESPRRAGVSSFGFGGTNAHVVLEEGPREGLPVTLSPLTSTPAVTSAEAPVFVFGGHGAQWAGMGQALYRTWPVFRSTVDAFDARSRALGFGSIVDALFASEEASVLDDTEAYPIAHPAVTALEVAATRLLASWGVTPGVCVGHSTGEVAAACAAGALSVDDALRVSRAIGAVYRATSESERYRLLYVGAPWSAVEAQALSTGGEVALAANNSPQSCVLSGLRSRLDLLAAQLQAEGVFCRAIAGGTGHTRYAGEEAKRQLPDALGALQPRRASTPFWSTSTNDWDAGEGLDLAYWLLNVRAPVCFHEGIRALMQCGHRRFLEVSPQAMLARDLKAVVRAEGEVFVFQQRGKDNAQVAVACATTLHAHGLPVDLSAVTGVSTAGHIHPACPLVLSSRSASGLRGAAEAMRGHLGRVDARLDDLAYSAATAREAHPHRLSVTATSRSEAMEQLDAWLSSEAPAGVAAGRIPRQHPGGPVFVFSGQGGQWVGMGRALYEAEPVFREALDRVDAAIQSRSAWSVREALLGEGACERLKSVQVIQPAIFTMQVCLAALWRSWGVEPAAVVGHSMGEVAAAFVAGALSLEDAVRIICTRSLLAHERASGQGGMAVVALDRAEAEARLEAYPGLCAAVHNAPGAVVVSGDDAQLDALLEALGAEEIWCRRVQVDYASHSPQMDALLPELRAQLESLSPQAAEVSFFSTVYVQDISGDQLGADYWAQNLRRPVRFAQAIAALIEEGLTHFVELSPHPVLVNALGDNLRAAGAEGLVVVSTRREQDERAAMLAGLGALWAQGQSVDWRGVFPLGGRRVDLPKTAWQRERYWIEAAQRRCVSGPELPLLGARLPSPRIEYLSTLQTDAFPGLEYHRLFGVCLWPVSATLAGMVRAAEEALDLGAGVLDEVVLLRPLTVPDEGPCEALLGIEDAPGGARAVTLHTRSGGAEATWQHVASARLRERAEAATERRDAFTIRQRLRAMGAARRDEVLEGITPSSGRWTRSVWSGPGEVLCQLDAPAGPELSRAPHPDLIDEVLGLLLDNLELPFGTSLPASIAEVRFGGEAALATHAHAWVMQEGESREAFEAGVELLSEDGAVLWASEGLRFVRADAELLRRVLTPTPTDWHHQLAWHPCTPGAEALGEGLVAVLVDTAGVGEALASALRARGRRVMTVARIGAHEGGADVRVDPLNPQHFVDIREALASGGVRVAAVVDLWALDADPMDPRKDEWLCAAKLHGVRAISGLPHPPRLWTVTRGAWPVVVGDRVEAPGQALAWGFARVVAVEHAELLPKLVDLDPTAEVDAMAQALCEAMAFDDEEDELAWRGGSWRALRLEQRPPPEAAPLVLREDATYLITGWSGGLGRAVTRWLVEQGARHLLLIARRAPEGDAGQLIELLMEEGVDAEVVLADVADADMLERAVHSAMAGRPELKGVMHVAGLHRAGMIRSADWGALAGQLGPKLHGAWALHQLTLHEDLDFFVTYSSMSAFCGFLGEGVYAAANAFLDAMAWHRAGQELPALSVGWGVWAGAGMAADEAREEDLRALGVRLIALDEGVEWLRALMGSDVVHGGATTMDWPRLAQVAPRTPPSLRLLLGAQRAVPAAQRASVLRQLQEAPAEERRAVLTSHLTRRVRGVLGLRGEQRVDPERGFAEQGMDSLMAVEFVRILSADMGGPLPATLPFNWPTVSQLTDWLLESGRLELERAGRSLEVAGRVEPQRETKQRRADEPIAIIGVGCRLPGELSHPGAFWDALVDGLDAVGPLPEGRWDTEGLPLEATCGGFLGEVRDWDASFFHTSPREAKRIDPQQRLALEVSWEALEHAGVSPERLEGSETGVFLAGAPNQYFDWGGTPDLGSVDVYSVTGNLLATLSGRVSYVLRTRGPSVALDTGCSSSLVTVHLACQSLRMGESSLALAGGVNVLLRPSGHVGFSTAGALAGDGHCKTFDARADGFVRSEGCGVVVLKRLSDALADGDRVVAVIRGTAVNHDGHSSGLTVPSGPAQQAVIRRALEAGGVDAAEVGFVETHGTGTALGDPIEVGALSETYGQAVGRSGEVLLGALKSNLGHTEIAAGVAGLIKAALCLQHGQIPGNLHFETPNPELGLEKTPFRVPTALEPWPEGYAKRVAGVSSFGVGGTNAHVVLEEAPTVESPSAPLPDPDAPRLLLLSARSGGALRALAGQLAARLESEDAPALYDVGHTLATRRMQHDHRASVAARGGLEAAAALRLLAEDEPAEGVSEGRRVPGKPPRVAFVFGGQGGQWVGMGRALYASEPAFRQVLDGLARSMSAFVDWSLLEAVGVGVRASLHPIHLPVDVLQPSIFAVQVALAQWLRLRGVEPEVVVGHSMGEVAAACVAGALSFADAARVICTRSALARAHASGKGGMAVTALSAAEVAQRLASYGERLSLAVDNAPGQTVISGDNDALDSFCAQLEADGVWFRRVKVDYASHCAHMDPLKAPLAEALSPLQPTPGRLRFFSTVSVSERDGRQLGPAYWVENLRQPVRFAEAIQALAGEGIDTFLELGPHPLLTGAIEDNLAAMGVEGRTIPTLVREQDGAVLLRQALGSLHCVGCPVDLDSLYPAPRPVVDLPTYPWQRQRYWQAATKPRGGAAVASVRAPYALLGERLDVPMSDRAIYAQHLEVAEQPWLSAYRLGGQAVLPGACALAMALAAGSTALEGALCLEGLAFEAPLTVPASGGRATQAIWRQEGEGRGTFELHARAPGGGWARMVKARWLASDAAPVTPASPQQVLPIGEAVGGSHPLDGVVQGVHVALVAGLGEEAEGFVPAGVVRVLGRAPSQAPHAVAVTGRRAPEAGLRELDVVLLDAEGQALLQLEGLRCQQVDGAKLALALQANAEAEPAEGQDWAALGADVRLERLQALVQRRLRATLGLSSDTPLEPSQDLFAMGLDSIMAAALRAGFERTLGLRLSATLAFQSPSPRELVRALLDAMGFTEDVPSETKESLEARWARDAVLDEDIRPAPGLAPADRTKPAFLTGGTGFLGAFVLAELLTQREADVVALVRAPTPAAGLARLQQNLEAYRLWRPEWAERIQVCVGDLARPRLGLSENDWAALAGRVADLFHVGARVHWLHPYAAMAPANVEGTRWLLRLAVTRCLKAVQHVSTLGIMTDRHDREELRELDFDDTPGGITVGYSQSKWVAEKLVAEASRRGVATTVHRTGAISGCSSTGVTPAEDFIHRWIAGCATTGVITPDLRCDLAMVPVDVMARAMVVASERPALAGAVLHPRNPHPYNAKALWRAVAERGYPVQPLGWEEWMQRIREAVANDPEHRLSPTLDWLERPEARRHLDCPTRYGSERFQELLQDASIHCPPLQALMPRYLEDLERRGVLRRGQVKAAK